MLLDYLCLGQGKNEVLKLIDLLFILKRSQDLCVLCVLYLDEDILPSLFLNGKFHVLGLIDVGTKREALDNLLHPLLELKLLLVCGSLDCFDGLFTHDSLEEFFLGDEEKRGV
jgi:hypothetical protein